MPPRAITKILLPSRRTSLLHRPRLVDFLHAHIERKLLLISASAGYGKTSLLIDLAHDTTLPVCWYSLDASDADPKTFLEYLLASLRRQFPNFGETTLGLLSDPAMLRDIDVVVGTLVTEIHEEIPGYFILVLDDYHTVEESESVTNVVDTLLRLLPENAHIILVSRTLPSRLTLTRLVARQEIAGLGANDLRFTTDEIRALVKQNYMIELAPEDAAQLAEDSEGWITGILLTTHNLWQGLLQDMIRARGSRDQVFNYLTEQVLATQPAEVQRFLLDSSILDQLDPSTCDLVLETSNSEEMMRLVEQRNLFVVRLEESDTWYRYHHLFQEFLQARLKESDVARWLDLNRRAAALFEGRAAWDQAIAHLLKAQAFDEVARVVGRVAREMFDAGRWTTLARWIDALPVSLLNSHPELLLRRGMVLDELGDSARAMEAFSRAVALFEANGDALSTARALVEQASCLRVQGRYQQAIQDSEQALTLIGRADHREAADAHRILGIARGRLGEWDECVSELDLALRAYEALEDVPRIALLHHDLGVAYQTLGKPEAQDHFERALGYWRSADNAAGLANTLNSIGVSRHRQGNYAAAVKTLEQALTQARRAGQLRVEALALASLGDVQRDMTDYALAQKSYQTAYDIGVQIRSGFVVTYTLNALGETFRLLGDLNTAGRLIRQALEQAESHASNYEVGLTKVSQGILGGALGDTGESVNNLVQATELLDYGGAQRENARAHLHLAQAHFVQRKYRLAAEQLKTTAELGRQIGEDQFAIADGKTLLPLIRYAVSKGIGNGFFRQLLARIESGPPRESHRSVEPTAVTLPTVRANAFGKATVTVDRRLVTAKDWDSAAAKELLFFMVANPKGLSKDQILGALWSGVRPARASSIFHSTVYRMRRALWADCLAFENSIYRLTTEMDLTYDVSEFEDLVRRAELARDRVEKAELWNNAVALYRGDYLEDSYADWCTPIRANLLEEYLTTLESLAKLSSREGRNDHAISYYQRILSKDGLRETAYAAIMQLQIRSGDRAGALKTYRQCAEILRDEMGLDPSPQTRLLYKQIARGDDRLT